MSLSCHQPRDLTRDRVMVVSGRMPNIPKILASSEVILDAAINEDPGDFYCMMVLGGSTSGDIVLPGGLILQHIHNALARQGRFQRMGIFWIQEGSFMSMLGSPELAHEVQIFWDSKYNYTDALLQVYQIPDANEGQLPCESFDSVQKHTIVII